MGTTLRSTVEQQVRTRDAEKDAMAASTANAPWCDRQPYTVRFLASVLSSRTKLRFGDKDGAYASQDQPWFLLVDSPESKISSSFPKSPAYP